LELEKINKQVFYKPTLENKTQTIFLSEEVSRISLENGTVYERLTSKPPAADSSVVLLASLMVKGKASLYEPLYDNSAIYLINNNGTNYWLQDDELVDGKLKQYYFKNILLLALNSRGERDVFRVGFNDKSLIEKISQYNTTAGVDNEIIEVKKEKSSFIIAGFG